MIINMFRLETEGLFRGLADYHQVLEAQIPILQAKEYDSVQNWAEEAGIEDALLDLEVDDLRWAYDYYFPRSLRYSFVVLLFLVVEKQLTEFCKTMHVRHNLPIKVNDLKGDFIERAKTYIHKLAGISPVTGWAKIEDLSVVRNCIVHTMGDVESSRDKVRIINMVSAQVGLSMGNKEFGDQNSLQISADFCSNAVKNVRAFFDELFDSAGMGVKLA